MRAALLGAALLLGAARPLLAAEAGLVAVETQTTPIAEFLPGSNETRFDGLVFLGGLRIVSQNSDLGSLSGIEFAADGVTLVAVADTGFWFTARLAEDNGRPTGLTDALIGPILGEDGTLPERKAEADAEGLRLVERDGMPTALVAFEQTTTLRQFAGPDFAAATPTRVALPGFVKGIRSNLGLEAIAVAPAGGVLDGAVVVIAERSLDGNGNHRGFILSGPRAGAFSISRTEDFDVTDADFLPDGDLLVLERRFSYSGGFAMRMRRIGGSAITPGATLGGTVLIEADAGYQIDNLEGLAVRAGSNGDAILTLVSDNNGSMFQRTILLQFALPPATPPMPRLRPRL